MIFNTYADVRNAVFSVLTEALRVRGVRNDWPETVIGPSGSKEIVCQKGDAESHVFQVRHLTLKLAEAGLEEEFKDIVEDNVETALDKIFLKVDVDKVVGAVGGNLVDCEVTSPNGCDATIMIYSYPIYQE